MLRSVFAFTIDNEVADRLDYGIYGCKCWRRQGDSPVTDENIVSGKRKGMYNGDFKTYVVVHKRKERRARLQ